MGINSRGFTIIETMLFLAIASGLAVIAFLFTSASLNNAQFTDTVRGFESFLKEQYSNVQSGGLSNSTAQTVNVDCSSVPKLVSGGRNAGNSNNCVLLGVLLDFGAARPATSVDVYAVFGKDIPAGNISPNDALKQSVPTIVDSVKITTYNMDWSSKIVSTKHVAGSSTYPEGIGNFRYLSFLRDPNSEAINMFAFGDPVDSSLDNLYKVVLADNGTSPSVYRNTATLICISSPAGGSKRGAVLLDGTATGRGMSIGAISSRIQTSNTQFFTDTSYKQTVPQYRGSMTCE